MLHGLGLHYIFLPPWDYFKSLFYIFHIISDLNIMEETAVFYNVHAKDACFFGGHKYWYNRNYKSKDGILTEYYVCANK